MKIKLLVTMITLLSTQYASAVGLNKTTLLMSQGSGQISQMADNTDKSKPHLIQVKVVPVNSPYDLEPLKNIESKKEILWSPSQVILPPGKSNLFNFKYVGPETTKEKYYAIQWTDSILSGKKMDENKGATVLAKATVSTVLVVHPTKEELAYKFDNKKLMLKNTGNISFKAIAQGACKVKEKSKEKVRCQNVKYITPGVEVDFSNIDFSDPSTSLGVWKGNNLLPVSIN